MDILKQLFPLSFAKKEDVTGLVVNLIIYLVVGLVASLAIAILSHTPLVGFLIGMLGGLVDLYVLVGIVLSVLDFLDMLK